MIEAAFYKLYNWALEPSLRGSDALLGRFRREFARWSPSMFSVFKVRSLAQASRHTIAKRHRVV